MQPTADLEKAKREYVERQVMPWLTAHLQMRSTGLQVFVAIQGALLYAFATTGHWALAALGFFSCVSSFLWDARNRDVFQRLHRLAESLVDRPLFGEGPGGYAREGLHVQALETLAKSGAANPELRRGGGFASHTWAIRIMIFAAGLIWFSQLVMILCRIF